MNDETTCKLKKIMTSVNNDFLEMIAVLETLTDIMEGENTDVTVLYHTQKLVRKVFNDNCKCKTILNLNE